MEEGRITKSGSLYTYEYFLKDHLGNNRSGFKPTSSGTAPSTPSFRSDYYPFGLQYQQGVVVSSPENKYLYNGKELQTGTSMLDYGARFYDPVIARWNVIDPKAELYFQIIPYAYAANTPINAIDPDGKLVILLMAITFAMEGVEIAGVHPHGICQILLMLADTICMNLMRQ